MLRLAADVGADRAMATLDADALDVAMQAAWGACAPATWNRHVATARSFVAFCRRRGWLAVDVTVASTTLTASEPPGISVWPRVVKSRRRNAGCRLTCA